MNAVERKAKRKLRLIVIRKIEVIEASNCLICPNRKSNDFECCKTCPIPSQLSALGKQLISVTHRDEEIPKVVEPKPVKKRNAQYERRLERKRLGLPTKKIPKVKPAFVNRRKKGDPPIIFTAEDFIKSVAAGEYKSEIARRIGLPDTTLHNRVSKWGLTGLTKEKAIEMLNGSMIGGDGIA